MIPSRLLNSSADLTASCPVIASATKQNLGRRQQIAQARTAPRPSTRHRYLRAPRGIDQQHVAPGPVRSFLTSRSRQLDWLGLFGVPS